MVCQKLGDTKNKSHKCDENLLDENNKYNDDKENSEHTEYDQNSQMHGKTAPKVKKKSSEPLDPSRTEISLLVSKCVTHIRILYGIIFCLVLVILIGVTCLKLELYEISKHTLQHIRLDERLRNASVIEKLINSWNKPSLNQAYNEIKREKRQVSF